MASMVGLNNGHIMQESHPKNGEPRDTAGNTREA